MSKFTIILNVLIILLISNFLYSEELSRFHPADTDNNGVIEESEFEAYNNAWRTNADWPKHSGPVPKDYLTRAGYISLNGGKYIDSGGDMPMCWMPGENIPTDIFTNSIGMTFVPIPAGQFKMGSPASELGRADNEVQHDVILTKSFFMQTTEVTQGQWIEIMGENPSNFKSCGNDCPVEQVSWDDIQGFITKLNQKEGVNTYRLPTEAEWEYAARAGTSSALYNGNITVTDCSMDSNLDKIAWYCGNADNKTHPVGQKQPNAWGLYDMSGNVWEWCQDWYGDYPSGTVTDPIGAATGSCRVLRGSSYGSGARYCRVAYRYWKSPGRRSSLYGFRLGRFPGQ